MKNIYSKILITLIGGLLMTKPLHAQEADDTELLNLSLEELMDIQVVNVSKINFDNLSEVPSAVTLVTADQIAKSGAKNMEEVMRNVPGFDVLKSGYNPSTNFGIRGLYSTNGTNNKILFLVDDHPVRSVFYGDASVFLGNFPVENIKQIEIIRGPGSTLFGAGAFLGVINIRTKEPENLASVSAFAGSFNTYQANAQITKKIGQDLKLTLLADYFSTEGQNRELSSDLSKEAIDPFVRGFGYTGESTSGTPGQLNYGRETGSINLKANYKSLYLLANYFNSKDETPVGPIESLVNETNNNNQAGYLEIGHRAKTSNQNGELLIKGYLDRYVFAADNDLFHPNVVPVLNYLTTLTYQNPQLSGSTPTMWEEGSTISKYTAGTNDILGSEINFAYNFNNYINVLVGGMYEHSTLHHTETRFNGNYLFSPITVNGRTYQTYEAFGSSLDVNEDYSWIQEKERNIYAAFGQGEFNIKNLFKIYGIDHFKVLAGLRYDGYSDVGGSINPRGAILFAPTRNVYFKGLYGKAFRAPSFVELYINNDILTLGDSGLKPENIMTWEGLIGFKVNQNFDLNLTYFNTKITDNIQLIPDDDFTSFVSYYANTGDIQTNGIEAEMRWDFIDGGYLTSSFTIQNVLDVTKGDSVYFDDTFNNERYATIQNDYDPGTAPNFILNLAANYPITRNININTTINHLGERHRNEQLAYEVGENGQPTGNIIQGDSRDPINARTLWNASIMINKLKFAKGLSIQATAYNLLDAQNYNPLLRIRESDMLREGRHWGVKFLYSF